MRHREKKKKNIIKKLNLTAKPSSQKNEALFKMKTGWFNT